MLLEAKSIYKVYGSKSDSSQTVALNYVDIQIQAGDFVAIMGPSGSGKTTLLNILNGLDAPSSGNVIIDGQDLFKIKDQDLALYRRKNLGFIYQNYHLLENLTIKENVMLPMVLDRKEVKLMKDKADELLQKFGISEVADKYPYQTSGGQQQRAAICRALINNPKVIFADEPTGNLNSKAAKTVMESLEKTNREMKTTILMVTHDPYSASYANRIIYLKDGKICSEGYKKGERKEFFKQIVDNLAVLEGDGYDI